MKKTIFILIIAVWVIGVVYVLLPAPRIVDMPNTFKSDESGDTVQVPGVSAFYNNLSRQQAVAYYQQQFCCSTLLQIPLLTYNLNHPPQYAKERIRDEIKAWYFEELVHPFRESLYVSGWTPALAQYSLGIKYEPLDKGSTVYYQKTTIRQMPTSAFNRLLVYLLFTLCLIGCYSIGKRALKAPLWQTT